MIVKLQSSDNIKTIGFNTHFATIKKKKMNQIIIIIILLLL